MGCPFHQRGEIHSNSNENKIKSLSLKLFVEKLQQSELGKGNFLSVRKALL